jgi:hypothetical protein
MSKVYVVQIQYLKTKGYARMYFNTKDRSKIEKYLKENIKEEFEFQVKKKGLNVIDL